VVQGPTIRLYTNGQRHYTLDKQFARGRVLRVSLGVDRERQDPVYLAGLRILAGALPPTAIAVNPAPPPGQPGPPPPVPPGTSSSPAPTVPVLVNTPTGSINPMPAPAPSPPPVTVVPAVPPPASITPMTPPQPPTVPAATGRAPLSGGASTIVPAGPATLTTSQRPGWGATLQWNEVLGATGYQVDRSVVGGAFMLFAGVDAKAQPAVAGLHSSEDVTVQPGTQYQYRIMAQFATGPGSTYSPIATFDAPTMIAQVSNLSATLGPPFKVTPTSTAPQRTVTWAWQGVPGALSYEAEIETFSAVSGGGGSLGKTRLILPATTYSASVETGRSVSICISLIRPATASDPLRYGICRMTDVTLPIAGPPPTPWFRVVALGFWVSGHTWDNVLNFDGVEDEVFLATVVNTTDLSLSSNTVSASKSATFGDIGGFPGRLQAGSASPNGGLFRGDAYPPLLDLNAPTGTPSRAFPLLLWEGPVDDQTMIVMHPTLWEEDKGINPYLAWVRNQTTRAKSGYIGITRTAIQSLRDAQAFGPGVGEKIASCVNPTPSRRIYIDVCIEGEDRPIGLVVFNLVDYWINDRFVVLTRASIEKSLSLPPSQGKLGQAGFNSSQPGIITVGFKDVAQQSPFGQGDYLLFLRVERMP